MTNAPDDRNCKKGKIMNNNRLDHHKRPARSRLRLAAVVAAGALVFASCASDDGDSAADADQTTTTQASTTTEAMVDDGAMGDMMGAFGPACGAVPADGEGSFAGMADDTAATAASNNPLLSTLVDAVVAADLVDTLNSDGPFTIFAPVNDAFAALPEDQLAAVLADQDLLTSVLTLHVLAGERLSSAELIEAGSAQTVNGETITFTADGDAVLVNGMATTLCMDVQTANATVHIIDSVLLPSS